MPKMSDIALFRQTEQPTLVVRATARVEELPGLIGESYGKIAAYLSELGELMTDMPFVCYHNMDMQTLDVEIGFPVARALPEREALKAGHIPAGYVVCCMYRGPYADMAPVYAEMAQWIGENGCEATGAVYEQYFNGPNFPESELLTKITMPVRML